ncbi:hypothetical protein C8R44DRAFT_896016 [Mycena epipterygia]|nr:hypothetical protein C8R44DRAFT_896016 [Mycena epipterygia]
MALHAKQASGSSAHAERRVLCLPAQKLPLVLEGDPFETPSAPAFRGSQSGGPTYRSGQHAHQQPQPATKRPPEGWSERNRKRKCDEAADATSITLDAQQWSRSSMHAERRVPFPRAQKLPLVLEGDLFETPSAPASKGSRSDAPTDQPRPGAKREQVSSGEGHQSVTHIDLPKTGSGAPPVNPSATLDRKCLLLSYKWSEPNSCLFDNGLEIWFRSWMKWDRETRKKFAEKLCQKSLLATIFAHYDVRQKWIYDSSIDKVDLMSIQHLMRLALARDYSILADETDFGCCRTWLWHIVMEQTADVRRYFGLQHSAASTCAFGHTTVDPKGGPQILVPINLFDWREIQKKNGSSCSLSDYLARATPRVPIGNAEGGTTPIHEFPLACSQTNCRHNINPETARIETAWPLILQISPEPTAMCPIPPRISIPTNTPEGGNVEYVLVGITSYEPDHWISDILIGNEMFHYNDMYACLKKGAVNV